jgi:hypothetical protein
MFCISIFEVCWMVEASFVVLSLGFAIKPGMIPVLPFG